MIVNDFIMSQIDIMTRPGVPRKNKSKIWNFMACSAPGSVKCLVCNHTYIHHGPSTSNLVRHLRCKHPEKYSQMMSTNSSSDLEDTMESNNEQAFRTQSVVATTGNAECDTLPLSGNAAVNKSVLRMIVSGLQPFSVVEDLGFVNLIKALNPQYSLPSKHYFSHELLPKVYADEKERLKDLLKETTHVSVSADVWTSWQKQDYITVTAHFITSAWELHSAVLGTCKITYVHGPEDIASALRDLFKTWDITDRVNAVVTNYASDLVVSIKDHLKLCHVPCFAQTLNAVVKNALNSSGALMVAIGRVRAIVSYFHHNVARADKLSYFQAMSGKPSRKLIQDVDSSWNSTIKMLQCYTEEHETVSAALYVMSESDLCLSDEELAQVNVALEALEPFDLAMEELLNDEKATTSKVLPIVQQLHLFLSNAPDSVIRKELQDQLHQRFRTFEDSFFIGASTLLDPRFKRLLFNESTSKKVEDRLMSMLQLNTVEKQHTTSENVTDTDSTEKKPKIRKSLWEPFDSTVKQMQQKTQPSMASPNFEFQRYIESVMLSRDEDPLLWWKQNETLFPKLSKLALQFLDIPATAASSEYLSVKTGELMSIRRSCLKDSSVDMMLFLRKCI